MEKRLYDVLHGKEENYLLPFYWQHGTHHDRIPAQIERIYQSGCRALCVESRPHEDFGGETWWADMDVILEECQKRDMKVWLLDDKHFPTGYANGLIPKKYPELRPWMVKERHVDVIGPMEGASLLMYPEDEENILLGVYAYKRTDKEQEMTGKPICLTDKVHENTLCFDVPEGVWRVFFFYKTRNGGEPNYIDVINHVSVAVLIEAVYEPHYQHYAQYFGNTFAGFFSDEPAFHNGVVGPQRMDKGFYEYTLGTEGMALPYSEELFEMMGKELGEDALPYLGTLWYWNEDAPKARLAYMNAATWAYSEHFCRQLGDWCRAHGVEYIGHVIEDMNCHTRLRYGTGHYFRALAGQDMSGIDIVLHQVMPGFAHYQHTAIAAGGSLDGEFFHYILAKLGASMAHLNPQTKGRAMCEVFGAYGWGEGCVMMKWLMDFLLVRGVNYFVPHAFSPDYPDPDCPPHFGAEGHDPQYDGFGALMRYTNKVSHLLTDAKPILSAAILYNAEAEWMNQSSMLNQKPAKALYDAHLDFDIVSADMLYNQAEIINGKLVINDVSFGALVVPAADYLPQNLLNKLSELDNSGLNILYVDKLPQNAAGKTVALSNLADEVKALGLADVTVSGDYPLLRIAHYQRNGADIFMLFNESASLTADTMVQFPVTGTFARLHLLENKMVRENTADGMTAIHLLPGQSEVIIFTECDELPEKAAYTTERVLHPTCTVSIADSEDMTDFRAYTVTDKLFNLNAPDKLPQFSGKIRYNFTIDLKEDTPRAELDLGKVGQTARLWVNGIDCGIRICKPYCFELNGLLEKGGNQIMVEVSNTLAQKQRDNFSFFLQLEPAGLLGDIVLRS